MKRPKGPELKMPDLKVPPFVADIYQDLRDRRLLPLVALVVVAIAAVPFLLSSSEEAPSPETAAESAGEAAEPKVADGSRLTVVEAHPGLRDYRKRLRARSPTNPFKQRYTSLPEGARLESTAVRSGADAGAGSGSGEVTVTEVDEGVTEVDTSPPRSAGGTPPGSGRSNPPDSLEGRRLYGFRPDVRFGVAGSGELALHTDLPLGSLLPKKNAVILFVGVTQNGERALFSVAPDIVVRGEGGCVGGAENCRFLSMRAGDAVDLLTGSAGRSFRLKVQSIDFVELPLPPESKSERASGSGAEGARRGMTPGLPQNFSN